MKTTIWLVLLALIASACVVLAGGQKEQTVDSYADHQKFCYKKCSHYKQVKGKCSDYEWVGTKKECCEYKTVGAGKCLHYKRFSKCDKYSKSRKLCLGHGYKQVCAKHNSEKYCIKSSWKNLCVHKGTTKSCDAIQVGCLLCSLQEGLQV